MSQVFVFTAGAPSARAHLDDSVRSPIPDETVLEHMPEEEEHELETIRHENDGFYAWGATPGPRNIKNWKRMDRGDWVLCGFDGSYRFVSRVAAKYENEPLAEAIWGRDDDGQTWQYVYFLTEPKPVEIRYEELSPPLHERYFGFTRIGDDRLAEMEGAAGSVDAFVRERLLNQPGGETTQSARSDLGSVCSDFAKKLRDAGLRFGADGPTGEVQSHDAFVRDFVVSLATKQLVILTGLSGSGKTQIALQFGRWLSGEEEDRYRVVPVRPDWTGPEALFGYEDALQERKDGRPAWQVPDPLKFMLRAARDPLHPYLMVLDEMNLAHVERYFADVISGMESGEECLPNLRKEKDGSWRQVPGEKSKIAFPPNLFIAGTVNVDETTYMFSSKVLDRANTMEFRVPTDALSAEARRPGRCAHGDPSLVRGFLHIARDPEWHRDHPAEDRQRYVELLKRLHRSLDPGYSFGHRVLYEAARFAALHEEAGGDGMGEALDTQVLQKILPRLHGSRRQLEPVLATVGRFCFDLEPGDGDGREDDFDPLDPPDGDPVLPRSFDKVRRMTRRLRANQFVSFTE